MSKFTFVVCDRNFDEFTINSDVADSMYQPWVDAHPEFGPTGDKIPCADWPAVSMAGGIDDSDYYGQHRGLLIDIGQATFGTDFDVSTYTKISVA